MADRAGLHFAPLTLDRVHVSRAEAEAERGAFLKARKAEGGFARQLRKIAGHIGELVRVHVLGGRGRAHLPDLQRALERYSTVIEPWARAVAGRAIAEVAQREEKAWARTSRRMSKALQLELANAPTGQVLREFLSEQVHLITSLPLEASKRVHDLTVESMGAGGDRAEEIAKQILATGEVTKARANLIARTEMARTQSGLTMVRAKAIGSEGYIWRTARDAAVRDSHAKLEGQFFRWDSPPLCDPPRYRAHAGMIFNCRCYCEPIIPDRW